MRLRSASALVAGALVLTSSTAQLSAPVQTPPHPELPSTNLAHSQGLPTVIVTNSIGSPKPPLLVDHYTIPQVGEIKVYCTFRPADDQFPIGDKLWVLGRQVIKLAPDGCNAENRFEG